MIQAIRKRQNYVPKDVSGTKVGGGVVSGSLWSGADAGFKAFISFVRSVILARLLSPADFGIVAIAVVFTQFVMIFTNFGFTASIIYYRDLKTEDIATCWWGNFTIDLLAALICIGFAIFSTRFVETPQTPWVIIILSAQFFLSSLGSINLALLHRLFRFKTTTLIHAISTTISFFSIIVFITAFDAGVYGLVWGTIVGTLCNMILYFYCMPWLPSLKGSLKTAKKHFKYGGWFLGVNVVTYINSNMDKAIISGALDNTQMGYFEYASRFPSMVVLELGQILNRVLFSAFSNLQGNFKEISRLLNQLFRYNTIIVFPMLFGLAAVAHDFTFIFYGEKWAPIILPMQLLCIYGSIRIFTNPLYSLANGIGKPHMPFKWAIIALPVNGVIMYVLVLHYGLEGVAAGKSCLNLYFLFTLGIELALTIRASFIKMLFQAFPALLCASLMVAGVCGIRSFVFDAAPPSVEILAAEISTGVMVYILSLSVFFPKDMRQLLSIFRKKPTGAR